MQRHNYIALGLLVPGTVLQTNKDAVYCQLEQDGDKQSQSSNDWPVDQACGQMKAQ